jgi:hypothetical protein
VKYNPLFRQGRRLTAERYQHWLWANGVRFVALPDLPLDPAARHEARLIRGGLPFLRQVWGDGRWRLFEVVGASSIGGRDAHVRRLGPSSFSLEADRAGEHVVRVRWTPYWRLAAGAGCVREGPAGWTVVQAARPGLLRVSARFDPARILATSPRCSARADG